MLNKTDVWQHSAFAPCPFLFAASQVAADKVVDTLGSSLTRMPSATPVVQVAPLPCLALARDTLASLKVPNWKGQAQQAMLKRIPVLLSPVC